MFLYENRYEERKVTEFATIEGMRKLIMWNIISLDGHFEGEKPWDLDFHQLVWGEELDAYSHAQLDAADMLVFGANTYTGMAAYWPNAGGEEAKIAEKMNAIPKVVCSSTLESAEWNNTSIVRDALAEIPALKQGGDGTMLVFGSGILSRSLMNAGLFDEYRLVIAPVILGAGRRLFTEALDHLGLTLIEARPLTTGGVLLRYVPVKK